MMRTMRRARIAALATLLLMTAASAAWAKRATGGVVALVNVRVVSMDPDARRQIAKRQTVIVEDGRITQLGKAKKVAVPDGATVIDGRNKLHVLPGLADLHVHNTGIPQLPEKVTDEDVYTFYFANGITTQLDMSGFKTLFKWRKRIERGKVVGPALNFTTPLIDEKDYESLDDLETDLRKWSRQGYEYVKSHSVVTEEFFDRLYDVADELGLPVLSHALRPGFPIGETLEREPYMIAHIEEILSTSVTTPDDFESQLEGPLEEIVDSRVWVTGTVNIYEVIADTRDDDTFAALLNRPEMRYLPPTIRALWELDNRYRRPDFGGSRDFWRRALAVKLYIAKQMVEMGALDRLLLGTDNGVDGIVPGFSVHDELRLLVEAGLTPWQAILTGTYNAAVFLGLEDEVGTVEEGKRADLLVVKKNPLKKINALADPAGVLVNGVWLDELALEARLEEIAQRWEE